MHYPQVIFFDAVGTLFGVRGSVGEIYAQLADRHKVTVEAKLLDETFRRSFKAAPPCTFPRAIASDIQRLEFYWWQAIVEQTFEQAGVLHQFKDFSAFFSGVYNHFATAAPWFLYADTLPTLKKLQRLEIPMGILSNFDSRLYPVLKALNLEDFFSSVTISTEAGAAKPDARIFQVALAKHHCAPGAAWHIGDSLEEDYRAAQAAGLRGVLVQRKHIGQGAKSDLSSLVG